MVDILPNLSRLACWFKADAGTWQDTAMTIAASADSDPIGAWADQSGNEFHAKQTVSGNRPVLLLNQLNSLPTVQFTANSQQFLSLGSVLSKPRAWSVFAIMSTASPLTRQSPFGSVNSAGQSSTAWGNAVISQLNCIPRSSAPDFGDGGSGLTLVHTPAIWTADVYNCIGLIHRDNEASILTTRNGEVQSLTIKSATASACTGPASSFTLGREGDYNGLYLDGSIAEIIVYTSDLLPVDRKTVENYLMSKWGL